MKKLKNNKVLYIIVFGLIVGAVGTIIYPILDLILYNLITHNKFVWNFKDHVIEPFVFGMIFSIVYCVLFEFRRK